MVMVAYWLTIPLLVQLALPIVFTKAVLKIYTNKKGNAKLD
jgi:hypothetical protein